MMKQTPNSNGFGFSTDRHGNNRHEQGEESEEAAASFNHSLSAKCSSECNLEPSPLCNGMHGRNGLATSSLFHDISDGDDECNLDLQTPLLDNDGSSMYNSPNEMSSESAANGIHDNLRFLDKAKSSHVSISAVFLSDYESSRPCSLPMNIESIQPIQLRIHHIRYSYVWQCVLYFATGCLFFSSSLDGFDFGPEVGRKQLKLTLFSAVVLGLDAVMRSIHLRLEWRRLSDPNNKMFWMRVNFIMMLSVLIETCVKTRNRSKYVVWSAILKPIVFFYTSSKARDGERLTWLSARLCVIAPRHTQTFAFSHLQH